MNLAEDRMYCECAYITQMCHICVKLYAYVTNCYVYVPLYAYVTHPNVNVLRLHICNMGTSLCDSRRAVVSFWRKNVHNTG